MSLEEVTLRFSGGLQITLWPRWERVAVVKPFWDGPKTMTFREFEASLREARKPLKRRSR